MSNETWTPDDAAQDRPSPARVYDYLLGGFHNFEIDRLTAEKVLLITPHLRLTAQISRAFLRRAVRYLAEQGIDQYLDIGSGIPTAGNVHEVAQSANPAARIVYVDIDPIAVAHSRAILVANPRATAIREDVRAPDHILRDPEVTKLLDFGRPIAIVLATVMHYVPDDAQAYAAVRRLREAMAPGSFLVIAHGTPEMQTADREKQLAEAIQRITTTKVRTADEILLFFEGLELVEPGLVLTPLWRPEGPDDVGLDTPELSLSLVGVGRKP
jgi:SAM-dependent methyltransferase